MSNQDEHIEQPIKPIPERRPKWFEYIQVRERRLLGTKVPPDFIIAFGPTNLLKPHATAEKAERQVQAIRNWLWTHMQSQVDVSEKPEAEMTDAELDETIRTFGLDPEIVQQQIFNKVCIALREVSSKCKTAEARVRELEQQLQEARSVIEELCDGIEDGGGTDGNGDTFDLRRAITFLEAGEAAKTKP